MHTRFLDMTLTLMTVAAQIDCALFILKFLTVSTHTAAVPRQTTATNEPRFQNDKSGVRRTLYGVTVYSELKNVKENRYCIDIPSREIDMPTSIDILSNNFSGCAQIETKLIKHFTLNLDKPNGYKI